MFNQILFQDSLSTFVLNFLRNRTNATLSFVANSGFFSFVVLIMQIISGCILVSWYIPSIDWAFPSVAFIMLEVPFGWFVRYWHVTGASFFFLCVYFHILKNMFYGSFQIPKHYVWLSGCFILILMMVIAFFGYILPWGNMSYWATVVVTNVITVFGVFGIYFSVWLSAGVELAQHTLSKFFALHYCLPFILLYLIFLHFFLLHNVSSSGFFTVKESWDFLIFDPFYKIKDYMGIAFLFFCQLFLICYSPSFFMHAENFEEADVKNTPLHIVPEWYFLPFYGILRATPSKLLGVVFVMFFFLFLISLPLISFHTTFSRTLRFSLSFQFFFFFFCICTFCSGFFGKSNINKYTLFFSANLVYFLFVIFFYIWVYLDFYFLFFFF